MTVKAKLTQGGDGTAIPTGFVGQQLTATVAITNFPATGVIGDAASLPLTPGVWDIVATCQANKNGAVANIAEWFFGVSAESGNSFSDLVITENMLGLSLSADPYDVSATLPPLRKSVTTNTTMYLKVKATYSSGTPRYRARIVATRIA